MKSNILSKKLKAVLSEKKLNKLGLSIGFAKRLRNIVPFELIISVIAALGDKETKHFSEIQRYFNQLTGKNVRYKPFHNQLAKPEFALLMREVTEKVLSHWVSTKLEFTHDVLSSFDKVLIQDGSSFAVHEQLQKEYPGRFAKISPAAVELHVTYDLKKGAIEKSVLTPDSFSERAELPYACTLKNQLLLGDRGYYSGKLLSEIDRHGGYYILRAMRLSKIQVHQARKENGQYITKNTQVL
jgi:Transposase DDE domain